jgi:ARG/rhodanese/phosphatase superfamily protein
MKFITGALTGVLLGGISLICLLALTNVSVRADGPQTAEPLPANWRIGAPLTHQNLTIFPVLSDTQATTDQFITLDQGIRSGKVKITELGADGRSRAINSRRQMSDSAEVNKLAVTNNSGKPLILIAGEIVVGGKQDRIVGEDCIIASTNKPVSLNVFCVEHGRWQAGSSVSQGRHSEGASSSAGGAGGGAFEAATVMAAPKVREKAQAKKDQGEVWSEVSQKVARNSVQTSTGTLNSVYENKRVGARLAAFERTLKVKLSAANVVGAVVAVNGELLSADVFASSRLFKAYLPKLLKSYALEAISADKADKKTVQTSDAEVFLSRVKGADTSTGAEGVYKLNEKQSDTDASFELMHTTDKSRLIHFNRVNKK